MSWEEQYLKHTQSVRVFSLERDAIEGPLAVEMLHPEEADIRNAGLTAGYDTDADDDEQPEVGDFEQIQLCEESPKLATIRTQAYRQAWEACQADMRSILENIYNDTIAQLHTFVRTAPTRARYGRRTLATGVILGANRTISSALSNTLPGEPGRKGNESADKTSSHSGTSHGIRVARISSRGCPNKRSALRTLIQGVIASDADRDNSNTDIARRPSGKKLSMGAMDDMETLVAWYECKYPDKNTAPQLAICFEELESFDSVVLTDLIEILSSYSNKIPFVLILAISTSIDALHTLLPRSTSELLCISIFTVTPTIETFYTLFFETFIRRSQSLTPGSKTFAFLRDTFLDLDQSIDGVIAKLHYMYLAHFYGNPYSALCHTLPGDLEVEEHVQLLGDIVPSLRALPSFQRMIDESTSQGQSKKDTMILRMSKRLLEDDVELLRSVNAARRDKEFYAKSLPQAWVVFDTLQSSWAEGRISTETLLTEYFSGNLPKRTKTACHNLRNARDDVVLAFLRRLEEVSATGDLEVLDIRNTLAESQELVEKGTRQPGLTRLVNGNIQGSIAKSEGDKHFTAFVKDLSERLEAYFQMHLKPFTELTFHELWFPEVYRAMRSAFHPQVLDQVQSSLITPTSRLPLHLIDDTENLPTLDSLDICKVYKLVSEAGKLVNLADWYGAFEVALEDTEKEEAEKMDESILQAKRRKVAPTKSSRNRSTRSGDVHSLAVNGHSGADDHKAGDSEDDDTAHARIHQARFLAAAADLAYLGFIQPTKRKVEHVARVVF